MILTQHNQAEWLQGLSDALITAFGKDTFQESELTRDFYVTLKIKCCRFFLDAEGVFQDELFWDEHLRQWLMQDKTKKQDRYDTLCAAIEKFNKERDWDQFHTPANLAKSISIEANELLEHFQWNDTAFDRAAVLEELADVANYCIQMSQVLNCDLLEIIAAKMKQNAEKYPVEKAKGSAAKYTELT